MKGGREGGREGGRGAFRHTLVPLSGHHQTHVIRHTLAPFSGQHQAHAIFFFFWQDTFLRHLVTTEFQTRYTIISVQAGAFHHHIRATQQRNLVNCTTLRTGGGGGTCIALLTKIKRTVLAITILEINQQLAPHIPLTFASTYTITLFFCFWHTRFFAITSATHFGRDRVLPMTQQDAKVVRNMQPTND